MARVIGGKPHPDAGMIEGFDIELTKDKLRRIDRLVDAYEKSIVNRLDSEYANRTRTSDRLADKIAMFGGSWKFIVFFSVFLFGWILWNSITYSSSHPGLAFDGPPFILLNLCLSFIAAFQAPIIMMSQNRQAARDRHESVIDFAINYKAEQEIDDIQKHLHRIELEMHELKELLRESAHNKQGPSHDGPLDCQN